ncbi:MAG TPA: aldo/keto reductase [Anaerolineales bacterium]|nr:aldo/keto reductase [Anaerolineales bacterium]
MEYRRLGSAGLKVSVLSFGSWVSFKNQLADETAAACMQAAYEAGCNFFDNAEIYANGESESIMGRVIKKLGWARETYVISTKVFWGLSDKPNLKNTLNRKYLMQAVDGSLKRLDLDFVDLLFCHRPDPETPIEEVAHAMHDLVTQGKALYWGTSEWSADQIRQAWHIADRYGWHKPQMEQPQYNLLWRDRVEKEYARLYGEIGLGTTIWSPLASGLLTGKYNNGVPADSRANLPGYEWLKDQISPARLEKVRKLGVIAQDLGLSLAHLSLAWCAKNPNVSTVITGASRVEQVHDNFKALAALDKLTPDVMKAIDSAVA